jgi:hypothetical protein
MSASPLRVEHVRHGLVGLIAHLECANRAVVLFHTLGCAHGGLTPADLLMMEEAAIPGVGRTLYDASAG